MWKLYVNAATIADFNVTLTIKPRIYTLFNLPDPAIAAGD